MLLKIKGIQTSRVFMVKLPKGNVQYIAIGDNDFDWDLYTKKHQYLQYLYSEHENKENYQRKENDITHNL